MNQINPVLSIAGPTIEVEVKSKQRIRRAYYEPDRNGKRHLVPELEKDEILIRLTDGRMIIQYDGPREK